MYSTSSRVPTRRPLAAIGAAVALAAGAFALGPAAMAQATPAIGGAGNGTADAVVLKTGLDVSLLNKTADVPLSVALNEVHAPANADKTLLSAKVDGVDGGAPVNILHADVATAKATSDATKSEGYVNLTNATVHVPGLPTLGLVQVDAVTSKATCETGKAPTAGTNFVGDVTVLGKKVSVRASGETTVKVAGVGEVSLELAKTVKTSTSAASTALQLKVHINPLKLNVAEVTGDLTLAKASCQLPGSGGDSSTGGSSTGSTTGSTGGSTAGSTGGSTAGSTSGSTTGSTVGSTTGSSSTGSTSSGSSGSGPGTPAKSTSTQNLAETGSSSATPYIAGAAVALVAAGGGAVFLTRRKKANASS